MTATRSKPRVENPTAAAIAFLAVPGRAERVLATHYQGRAGWCGGCSVHLVRWPCTVARLAQQAVARRAIPAPRQAS
jgi:hypothetical protein